MRAGQLTTAMELIIEHGDLVTFDNLEIFDGFGLRDFKPVTCTIMQLAGLVMYQCRTYAGTWDNEALDEIKIIGRRKFTVIG